jgi:hypothetical protein
MVGVKIGLPGEYGKLIGVSKSLSTARITPAEEISAKLAK